MTTTALKGLHIDNAIRHVSLLGTWAMWTCEVSLGTELERMSEVR